MLTSAPASAQISVFDPANYRPNLLTAARTLSQINNQIQSLHHEAQMLVNPGKNLASLDFPQHDQLRQPLGSNDRHQKSVSLGKRESVRSEPGGGRNIKRKNMKKK